MKKNPYAVAGWLAIAAAILIVPMFLLGILVDVVAQKQRDVAPLFLVAYLAVTITQTAFDLYAFSRLRGLLNERFGFHAVDKLIVAIILGVIALVGVIISSKILLTLGLVPLDAAFVFTGALFLVGLPLNILCIIFAVKLLSLEDDLQGLLKPYAYTTIAAAICFASFILVPFGLLAAAAAALILGIIFLRAGRQTEVEFV